MNQMNHVHAPQWAPNPGFTVGAAPGITVEMIVLKPTGTYNDHVMRPMTAADTHGHVSNQLAQASFQGQSMTEMAGMVGQILQPAMQHEGIVPIRNGWSERKLRWVMIFWVTTPQGGRERYVANGWTEHADNGFMGSIDPQMVWVVNAMSRMAVFGTASDQLGQMVPQFRHVESNQYMYDPSWHGIAHPGSLMKLRPVDAIMGIQSATLESMLHQEFAGLATINGIGKIGSQGTLSDRSNANPMRYIEKLTKAWKASCGKPQGNSFLHTGEEEFPNQDTVINEAGRLLEENAVVNNPLFTALHRVGCQTYGRFTLGHLRMLDPHLDHKLRMMPLEPHEMSTIHSVGSSEYWHVNSPESHLATMIVNVVPSYMLEVTLQQVFFEFVSGAYGRDTFIYHKAKSLVNDGQNLAPALEIMKSRFLSEAVPLLTMGGQYGIKISVYADTMGEWTLDVGYSTGPSIRFVHAGFADSVVTPMMTYNPAVASGISLMANTLGRGIGSVNDIQHIY